jgi:hypothetical protein
MFFMRYLKLALTLLSLSADVVADKRIYSTDAIANTTNLYLK